MAKLDPTFKDVECQLPRAQKAAAKERTKQNQRRVAAAARAAKDKITDSNAIVICQNYVKASLKSPSTADFP